MSPQVLLGNSGEIIMNGLNTVKNWLGALVDIGLVLLALGIVLALLAGPQVPFLGNVVTNIVTVIGDLGKSGIVGLIAVGVILWLFKRAVP
jgi:ABC-type enterochelin transport system permease subunit